MRSQYLNWRERRFWLGYIDFATGWFAGYGIAIHEPLLWIGSVVIGAVIYVIVDQWGK